MMVCRSELLFVLFLAELDGLGSSICICIQYTIFISLSLYPQE